MDSCLHHVDRYKFFGVACVHSNHPSLPTVLFLRPLITSKYLSFIVFLDFHSLALNPPLLKASVTFTAFCCPNLWLLFASSGSQFILSSMWAAPGAHSQSFLSLVALNPGCTWRVIPVKRSKPRSYPTSNQSTRADMLGL